MEDESRQEARELAQGLIERVEKGENIPFEYLSTFSAFLAARSLRTATEKIISGFEKEATRAYDKYLEGLKNKVDNLQLLVNHRFFKKCADFYKKDLSIIENCIEEYKYYVFSWHVVDTLLGIPRREEDMWDHRYVREK